MKREALLAQPAARYTKNEAVRWASGPYPSGIFLKPKSFRGLVQGLQKRAS